MSFEPPRGNFRNDVNQNDNVHISQNINYDDEGDLYLLQSESNIELGPNLLHQMTFAGHIKHVEFLISNGADVNRKDPNGYTPLYIAVSKNNFQLVKYLISKGADLNLKDCYGSCLHKAVKESYI